MSADAAASKSPPQWLSLLRLMRFPTVFTAIGDILCGSAIALNQIPFVLELIPILLASICLYLSGMVFNDVFDYQTDLKSRANRPLPNGNLSVKFAAWFGSVLMLTGLIIASPAWSGRLGIALVLAAFILLYDVVLKQTPLAPLIMGGCRGLNLILGASLVANFAVLQLTPIPWVAGAMTLYITGVTLFARQEAVQSPRFMLAIGLGIIYSGLVLLAFTLFWQGEPQSCLMAILLLGFIGLNINRKAFAAVGSGSPLLVQAAVRTMLLSLLMIHATLIYGFLGTHAIPLALMTLALLIPAKLMVRVIAIT